MNKTLVSLLILGIFSLNAHCRKGGGAHVGGSHRSGGGHRTMQHRSSRSFGGRGIHQFHTTGNRGFQLPLGTSHSRRSYHNGFSNIRRTEHGHYIHSRNNSWHTSGFSNKSRNQYVKKHAQYHKHSSSKQHKKHHSGDRKHRHHGHHKHHDRHWRHHHHYYPRYYGGGIVYDNGDVYYGGSDNRTDSLQDPQEQQDCENRAKEYEEKAQQARSSGKQELYNAYLQCASAERTLAKAYKYGDRNLLDIGQQKLSAALDKVNSID